MKKLIQVLDIICIAAVICFFALMVAMVGTHIAGLLTLNGELASGATALIRPVAGRVGAAAALSAFALGYLRKLS